MLSPLSLSAVVEVDVSKCVNCHVCISVCPVKYCNDGSGDVVKINHDTCIGCGKCIEACTHDARYYIDDFKKFTDDIISGEKIVAVSAPAVAGSFPDQYLQLNTFLKELGVSAVFDVSFGAELTIKSYVEYIKKENPQTIIAQPCPAIVNYIELYKPELIKYLAPIDSPILHTIKMIKKYYPSYKDYKVAVISPCIAKKREFEETGYGDYNITMKSIDKFLKDNNIDLKNYEPTDFDNPQAERAVMFSSPGGLTKTLERWIPDVSDKIRQIEGTEIVYDYLDKLSNTITQNTAPLLVDCLSCQFGCNQGPGTLTQNQSPDETEFYIKKRATELKQKYLSENENNPQKSKAEIEKILNKYWEEDLYKREYINRWQNFDIKYPTRQELDKIYAELLKETPEDIQNCAACGYGTCEGMAIAIHNGLNKVENCHLYRKKSADKNLLESQKAQDKLKTMLETAQDGFMELDIDETILNANEAMKQILKKSDIIGRSLYEFLSPENIEILENELKKRKKGKQSTYELHFTRSDGTQIPVLVSASPLYDFETQKLIGSFAMVTDITRIKQTEAELQEAKENLEQKVRERTAKLNEMVEELNQQKEELQTQKEIIEDERIKTQNILEMLPNAAFMIDKNGFVTFWNKALEDLTGVKAQEIIGKGNFEYAVPFYGKPRQILIDLVQIDDVFLHENYKNIQKVNNILKAETYVPSLRGKERYLIGYATAIYGKDGEYQGAIEVIEDFTVRQKQQEAIEKQKEELSIQAVKMEEIIEELNQQKEELLAQKEIIEAEKRKTAHILETLPNPALIIDSNGYVTYWNKALEKLTGYSAEQMIGRGNHEYAIPFYGEARPILIDLVTIEEEFLAANYKGIEKNGNILRAETYVPSLRGKERYLIGYATAIYDENGNYLGAIEVIEDYTIRQKQQEKIEQQKNEIIQQTQRLSEMLEEAKINNEIIQTINEELSQLSIVASETDNAIIIMDRDGNFEWVNKAFTNIYGLTVEQIKQNPIFNILKRSRYKRIRQAFNDLLETGKSTTFDMTEKNKDGQIIYAQTTLSPVFDDDNNITKVVAIKLDITNLKKAEEELKKLSIVASETDNAIIIMDKDGNIEWVNKAFTDIYGFSLETLIESKGKNIKQASSYEHITQVFDDVIQSSQSQTFTSIEKDNKDNTIYTQTTLTPIFDDKNNLINVVAINSDVTELKKSEALLREYAEEIKTQRDAVIVSSEKIKQIVQSLPDAAFVIDENGKIQYWNSAIEEMTGFYAEEMIGKGNFEYAIPFYGERRPILIDLVLIDDETLERNYTGITRKKNILQAETYVPSLREKEHYLLGTATALFDKDNKYLGAIEVIHDITERQYHLQEIEQHRQNILQSINYAKNIQDAMLPQLSELDNFFAGYLLFFKPRDIVSGDFYWIRSKGNKIIVVAADCTGHGVPGAFMSMLGISLLGQVVSSLDTLEPNVILDKTRDMIIKYLVDKSSNLSMSDGMDLTLIIYDKEQQTIEYTGANNPLYIVSEHFPKLLNNKDYKRIFEMPDIDKKIYELKVDRMPVGNYMKIVPFSKYKISVNKGDRLFLFSDGFPDLYNSSLSLKFTARRFKKMILSSAGLSISEQKNYIINTFNDWTKGAKQIDDVIVIGLEV